MTKESHPIFNNTVLTKETAKKIRNWGEKTFATATTSIDHLIVIHHVPVGTRNIDFWVKNTRMNGKSQGKFVEVTEMSIKKISKKRSQINAMKKSRLPYTVIFSENLMKISKHIREETAKDI